MNAHDITTKIAIDSLGTMLIIYSPPPNNTMIIHSIVNITPNRHIQHHIYHDFMIKKQYLNIYYKITVCFRSEV
jgi:hypothetical protein